MTATLETANAASVRITDPLTMVLFGASGDLASRMIVPSIFRLSRRGMIPPEFRLVGFARSEMTTDEFREKMRAAVMVKPAPGDEEAWPAFAARMHYEAASYSGHEDDGYERLKGLLERFDQEAGAGCRRLFYLSVPPGQFAPIIGELAKNSLAGRDFQPTEGGWSRVIIEKPFGRDLASARALQAEIVEQMREKDIYRIDHFLGKEAAQNLFAFRFANAIFEPVWNRNYIDCVQITACETLGMENRGSFYETAGALRDMIQNHLMQLMTLVALEPPARWSPDAVRDEKVKVLRSIRRIEPSAVASVAVRGQYGPGQLKGQAVAGYREEPDVAADSSVETYAAVKLMIDNWRWAGVPFYLRSGKRLGSKMTEIAIRFKHAPHSLFNPCPGEFQTANTLVVRLSPDEGISLQVESKLPGEGMCVRPVDLDYYASEDPKGVQAPSPYEHLLLDAMRGDSTFFTRADEVEAAWEVLQPVIDAWSTQRVTDFPNYAAGSSGPIAAEELLARDGRRWRGIATRTP